MAFDDILDQVIKLLQRQGRVSYRALQRRFDLDDTYLDDLKGELLFAYQVMDESDQGLVWTGDTVVEASAHETAEQRFQERLFAVIGLLHCHKSVTYRSLKHILHIDDAQLAELCEELRLRRLATDEEGKVLVWLGDTQAVSEPMSAIDTQASNLTGPIEPTRREVLPPESSRAHDSVRSSPEAERRQLTVMFCDLVGSTDLSRQLDPEDLREVIRTYQETAAQVVEHYQGHIAQYLGDGLLIYFGYPIAHEDDAHRAVHTGLGIVEAMGTLNPDLKTKYGIELAVRIGIHTGLVVVGEMGSGEHLENLALGETPNIAARIEGLSEPDTVAISPVTARLVRQAFVLHDMGQHDLKGVAEPMVISQVIRSSESERGYVTLRGFDALVGRDEEIGLLMRRWEQSKDHLGQVILLSGEAGIGKSSLVDGLRHHVRQEGLTRFAFRCSPYLTNSALYPIIDSIQRTIGWQSDDLEETKLIKLERALETSKLSLHETVPLMASLLSLALPEGRYPALTLNPQQQRQQTQDTLVAWLQAEAERQAMLAVWEDLHWADPSTLEVLSLILEQAPTLPMLHLLTFRPEFEPSWSTRSHMTPMTLNRLERPQVESVIDNIAMGKALPLEAVEHIVTKTDGVPLYVEELTKMLLESKLLCEEDDHYVLTGPMVTLAIPETLQDSLMARLDQMNNAKEVAQLGAVVGREFSYEILQAISTQDEATVRDELSQLVEAELLYQRGQPPRSRYIFKHALIQDAAYASLLRSACQNIHQKIAETLEVQFPETVALQPELVAHHYSAAGHAEAAVTYWHQASERDRQNSSYTESLAHLNQALSLLSSLPDTRQRAQHELRIQMTLGLVLTHTIGHASTEVGEAYARARELSQDVDDPHQLSTVLAGLRQFYLMRAQYWTACEVGEQFLQLAQQLDDRPALLWGQLGMGVPLYFLGELTAARDHLERGIALYHPSQHSTLIARYGSDTGMGCRAWVAQVLWTLGYPDQALHQAQEATALVQDLSHPHSLGMSLLFGLRVHQFRRDVQRLLKEVEALSPLAETHGFPFVRKAAAFFQGWGLALDGQGETAIRQIRDGLDSIEHTGTEAHRPYRLSLLAHAYGHIDLPDQGLPVLSEALQLVEQTGERYYEAEIHRLKGELLLQLSPENRSEAENCYQQSIAIAQAQSAKSWELRTASSLARLWQSQGKRQEAHDLLAPVYEWFTEGFDTPDLIDAKALLVDLSEGRA